MSSNSKDSVPVSTFNAVSETALITLKARVVESSKKEQPVIEDPVALECFNRLQPFLPAEVRNRLLDRELPSTLTRYIGLRARKYDGFTGRFLREHPDGLTVSLGCGFDTRFWRISEKPWKYVEVDLPAVIEAKSKVLGDIVNYPMIGCSVLEEDWMKIVSAMQKEQVLFLAEGLFMYLPKEGVIDLFNRLSKSFTKSEIVFEVVNEKYTKGLWKKMVSSKISTLGTQAGSSYQFGIRDVKDVETYGNDIRVLEEWSYFEDEDIQPGILKLLRNVKLFSRTQWTVRAAIGTDSQR